MSKYYIGIMCGTSLDSIDVSNIYPTKMKVRSFNEYKLSKDLKEQINLAKKNIVLYKILNCRLVQMSQI